MLHLLFVISLIGSICTLIKEARTPTIPAENWANEELHRQDILNGVPIDQVMKNLADGKYKLTETYPEPHRNERGQIVIENSDLYWEDVKNYGAYQASKWVKQGKYNLNPEELQKKREEYEKKYEKMLSYL